MRITKNLSPRNNVLKEKLSRGEPVLGTWVTIPSAVALDVICSTGLDFVILDTEHGPLSIERIQELAMVAESSGVSPVARVTTLSEGDILRVLDTGVCGVQVPNVDSATQAAQIVKYAKFPPLGNRGFSPFTRAGGYGGFDRKKLTQDLNAQGLVVINIEGDDVLDRVDSILAVEGIDVVFIGLFDLSKAMGVPGDVNNPRVQQALKTIVDKVKASGKVAGTIATSSADMDKYLEMGLQYLVYLVDADMLRSAYGSVVEAFHAR